MGRYIDITGIINNLRLEMYVFGAWVFEKVSSNDYRIFERMLELLLERPCKYFPVFVFS